MQLFLLISITYRKSGDCNALVLMLPDLVRVELRPNGFIAASPLRVGPFFIGESLSNPETALWRGVIQQAWDDALGDIDTPSNLSITEWYTVVRRARSWFSCGTVSFQRVCHWADLDPDVVRAKAMKAIKESGFKVPPPHSRKRLLRPGKLRNKAA